MSSGCPGHPFSQVHFNVKVHFGSHKMQFRHPDCCPLVTGFTAYEPKCKHICIIWVMGGGGRGLRGCSMIRLGLSCFPAILSPISMSDKEAIYDFFIFGGLWAPLRQTQENENFRAVRPHHRADKCITREKITTRFSYMGHNIQICAMILSNV